MEAAQKRGRFSGRVGGKSREIISSFEDLVFLTAHNLDHTVSQKRRGNEGLYSLRVRSSTVIIYKLNITEKKLSSFILRVSSAVACEINVIKLIG